MPAGVGAFWKRKRFLYTVSVCPRYAAWGRILGGDPDVNILDQRIVAVVTTLGAELGDRSILLQLGRRSRKRQAGIVGIEDGLCAKECGGRLLLVLL
jgi:hypothetical protein